jgi:IS5 family transposase
MTDTPAEVAEALELADMLQTFAYEQGFHECGYDPIKRLRAHIADLQSQLAAQRERDGRDAARWRALLAGRVRVLGSAGLHSEVNPYGEPHNRYAHIGLELWTKHEAESYPRAVDDLTKYADIAVAAMSKTLVPVPGGE